MKLVKVLALSTGIAAYTFAASVRAETEITVGVITDMSGLYSDFSGKGSVEATRLAIEDFMAGHPDVNVRLISADHQNKPDLASTIAREW